MDVTVTFDIPQDEFQKVVQDAMSRTPDYRLVVFCKDCKHNNACLTQSFVEDESRVPFDRNTFFCADGRRADNDASA